MNERSPQPDDDRSLRDVWDAIGEPTMVCRPSRVKAVGWGLIASAVGLTGLGFAILALALQGVSTAVVVGAVLALVGAALAVTQFRRLSLRVYVCRDGFAVARRGTVETCRWGDVETLWEHVIKHYWVPAGIHIALGSAYKLRVRRADGAEFKFAGNTSGGQLLLPGNLYGVADLGAAIRDATHHRLLSQAEASVRAGGAVAFGPLQVTERGLSRGTETLPWSEVESVAFNDADKIVVRKAGRWRSWCKVKASAVPNLSVFVALVNQIRG